MIPKKEYDSIKWLHSGSSLSGCRMLPYRFAPLAGYGLLRVQDPASGLVPEGVHSNKYSLPVSPGLYALFAIPFWLDPALPLYQLLVLTQYLLITLFDYVSVSFFLHFNLFLLLMTSAQSFLLVSLPYFSVTPLPCLPLLAQSFCQASCSALYVVQSLTFDSSTIPFVHLLLLMVSYSLLLSSSCS